MRRRLATMALRWSVFAAVLVGWQFAVRLVPEDDAPFFPTPEVIGERMHAMWFTGGWSHLFLNSAATATILPSLGRMFGGWGAACLVGTTLGILLGRSRHLLDYVEPLIHFLRALPPPALVPVFIVLLKLTDTMRISVIAFGVLFPILLNSIEGARAVEPVLMDTARVFRLTRWERFRRIILPAASPKIFAGLRISLAMALILMVVSELIGGTDGIGYTLLQAKNSYLLPDMWACIVLLGILGYVCNAALLWTERRILAWHRGAHGLE